MIEIGEDRQDFYQIDFPFCEESDMLDTRNPACE